MAERAFIGFQRIADPGACDYCIMLASRGADYGSRDAAAAGSHDNCGCVVAPVFAGDKWASDALRRATDRYTGRISREDDAKVPFGRPVREHLAALRDERQRSLGLSTGPGFELDEHELVFYERFLEPGNQVQLIPKSNSGLPTNDFTWLNQDGIEIELKRVARADYSNIVARISGAIKSAYSNHGVSKENFIVDVGDREVTPLLISRLGRYNDKRTSDRQIERLWVFSKGNLYEVPLATKK